MLDFSPARKSIIGGDAATALGVARGRMIFVITAFAIGFLAVSLRLVDLTLIKPNAKTALQTSASSTPPAAMLRADILDRNGELIASSLKTASLYADPRLIDDPVKVAGELVKILPEQNYGELLQTLQKPGRFIWIQRNLTPRQQYAVNALGHPGLSFQEENRRIYPQGTLFSHILGYTDIDGHGIAGAEKSFDGLLVKDDQPLELSLDMRLQHIVRKELADAVEKFSAKGASGIIMDIKTGEILSMVSLPDFDPHNPAKASGDSKFNRNTLGVFEMGSTFKLFSITAAIESGAVRLSDSFDATKPIHYGRFTIEDYHAERRIMTVPEIFIHSSNIGTARIAERTGGENLRNFYEKLGFFSPARIELPEIGAPLVPRPWRDITTLTASFGHGISVSPLQVAVAAAGIVGNGRLPTPTIIKSKNPDQGTIEANPGIVSPQTSAKMRQLMELVVESKDGTGGKARLEGYHIGGKTGTAEKVVAGGYSKNAVLSSFLAAFPIEHPRYLVLAIMDEPKGTKETFGFATAGWTAAPAVRRIVEQMAPLYNMAPDDHPSDVVETLGVYLQAEEKHAAF